MNVLVQVINQLFEIKTKLTAMNEAAAFERNFSRLQAVFEEEGLLVQDPTGEAYHSSRADCEASIVGQPSSKMKISKTLKPVIYKRSGGEMQLLQKAIVIAEKQ